jgi:hypothetical protein
MIQFSNSRYASALSRHSLPELCWNGLSPSPIRGSRKCRMHAAPAVSCARLCEESAHEHTGSAEALRHSLRNGFTAYSALSPATNSFLSPSPRRLTIGRDPVGSTQSPRGLASATDARTTRLRRTLWRRSSCAPVGRSRETRPANTCAPTPSRPPHPLPRS